MCLLFTAMSHLICHFLYKLRRQNVTAALANHSISPPMCPIRLPAASASLQRQRVFVSRQLMSWCCGLTCWSVGKDVSFSVSHSVMIPVLEVTICFPINFQCKQSSIPMTLYLTIGTVLINRKSMEWKQNTVCVARFLNVNAIINLLQLLLILHFIHLLTSQKSLHTDKEMQQTSTLKLKSNKIKKLKKKKCNETISLTAERQKETCI